MGGVGDEMCWGGPCGRGVMCGRVGEGYMAHMKIQKVPKSKH